MTADPPLDTGLAIEEAVVAELLGDYIERRSRGQAAHEDDLLCLAAEFGPRAADLLRVLMRYYDRHHTATERDVQRGRVSSRNAANPSGECAST